MDMLICGGVFHVFLHMCRLVGAFPMYPYMRVGRAPVDSTWWLSLGHSSDELYVVIRVNSGYVLLRSLCF